MKKSIIIKKNKIEIIRELNDYSVFKDWVMICKTYDMNINNKLVTN